jgi:hypothetical protein
VGRVAFARVKRLLRLRAVEWALLGFVVYVVARCGVGVLGRWREFAGLRTVSVACVMALVLAVGLAQRLIQSSWPAQVPRGPWWVLGAIAVLPTLFASGAAISNVSLHRELAAAPTAQVLPVLATVALRVVGFGLGPVLAWLGLGLHLTTHSAVRPGLLLREAGGWLAFVAREWVPLLLILSGYAFMAALFDDVAVSADETLAAVDRWLFGGSDPLDLLEALINRPLSEWLAFSYSFYALLYPLVLGACALRREHHAIREASFVLGVALLVAYVLYTLVPARGPILSRTFATSLELYTIAPVKEALMDATRITFDCFPSMHTCTSLLLGWLAWRHARQLFWLISPMVASIPLACVYLRYHYVVDVVAGAGMAAAFVAVGEYRARVTKGARKRLEAF